jgi:hypothetical protein
MSRLVLDMEQAHGVGLVPCAQAGLLAGGGILDVVNTGALKHNELIFHVRPFRF